MAGPSTKFSLLNPKTRIVQIAIGVVVVTGISMSSYIVSNWESQNASATGFGKIVVPSIPPITAILIALLLVFPFRYVLIDGGVRIDSILTRKKVRFNDVEHVVLDVSPNQKQPFERVMLACGGKENWMVGLAADFDKLRDFVLASVDPAIVEDRRRTVEVR